MSGNIHLFDLGALLVVVAALFGVINHHFLRLPFTIGLMVSGLAASIAVALADRWVSGLHGRETVQWVLGQVDLPDTLMHGMLGFLLFAGALHVDLDALLREKEAILGLASVGVLLSTLLIGIGSWLVFLLVGVAMPFLWCLILGAIVSPTDPIAVLGLLRAARVPKRLEIKIVGESLFNDGIGVVVFSVLVTVAAGAGHASFDVGDIFGVLLAEVVGGGALGLASGYLVYRTMARLEEPNLEVLLSVALVMGITAVAIQMHASAPLACVLAGLFLGNHGRRFAMGADTRQALDVVWSFLEEILNAVLFLLVGIEVVALTFDWRYLGATALLVPLALAARFLAVLAPVTLLRLWHAFTPGIVRILTWGGLRGGISVALALSLPPFQGRDALLFATYGIVLFSLLVQGLTIGKLSRRLFHSP